MPFPTTLATLPRPSATTLRNAPGYALHSVIDQLAIEVEAIEAKLGIGASTPGAVAAVLRRTATGSSAWGQVASGDIAASAITASHLQVGAASTIWSVTGTTSSPTTTQLVGSGGVLIPQMTLPITTTGSSLLILFGATIENNTAGHLVLVDLFLDSSNVAGRRVGTAVVNTPTSLFLMHVHAVGAGAITIQARWSVTGGTALSYGTERRLTAIELRR